MLASNPTLYFSKVIIHCVLANPVLPILSFSAAIREETAALDRQTQGQLHPPVCHDAELSPCSAPHYTHTHTHTCVTVTTATAQSA